MLKQQEALSTELWLATKWFLFCWYYFKNCSLLALALLFTRKDGHLQIVDMMQHALMRNWSWDTYSSLNIPILSNFTNPLFERICNWLPPRACRLISWLCMWGNWGPGWFLPVCKAALVPSQGRSSGQLDGQSRPSQIFANWFLKFSAPQVLHCDVGQWPALHQHGLMGVCRQGTLSTTGIGNN